RREGSWSDLRLASGGREPPDSAESGGSRPPLALGCQGSVIDRLVLIQPSQIERHNLRIFLRRPGVKDHHVLVRTHPAVRAELGQAIEADRSLWTDSNPLQP